MSQNNQDCTVWTYNGNDFQLDISNADDAARFEEAMTRFKEADDKRQKDGSLSEIIVAYDKAFRDMYDDVFGDGAGDAILGDVRSIKVCNASYESFLSFIECQGDAFQEMNNSIAAKYNGNRAQRRANQFSRH